MKPTMRQSMTRREALRRVGKFGLFTTLLGSPVLRSWAAKPEFKFIVVNDTHYMSKECGRYLEGLVRQMNREGASLCLHAGDLTDKGTPKDLKAVRKIFAGLNMPFYPVIGNHDYATQTDRRGYLSAFPLRLNYHFRHRGWQFIGLDTTEGQHYEKTRISRATFEMLTDILWRLNRQKPTVVFTHFPLCETVKMRPLNADDLLARFDGWNVRAIFSGHYHGFTECERGEMRLTTNRCCALKRNNHDGTKEKGYFVCTASGEMLTRKFVEYKGV